MAINPDKEPAGRGAIDVIRGPIGAASLRDPASSRAKGADLDGFPVIDAGVDESDATTVVPRRSDDSTPDNEPNAAIRQLEAIIGNLTTFATPVLREIAARAAELAAKAGEAAGPVAYKAAAATEQVGGRLAVKGHGIASGLRSERAGPGPVQSVDSDDSTSQAGPPSP